MQISVFAVVILLLESASSEPQLDNVTSSLLPISEMSPTTTVTKPTTPEATISFGEAYGIHCENGACRVQNDSIIFDEWMYAKRFEQFHQYMNTLKDFLMPVKLVGDYHFANEVVHTAGYLHPGQSKENLKKHFNRILKSMVALFKEEGTYYNHPENQIFLCLNKNYSKPIQKCTTAINEAYKICGNEHSDIKKNRGICKVPEIFNVCKSVMNVHIREHCQVDPRPELLEFVGILCNKTGDGQCGTFDSFYHNYNSCLPIGMRKELENIGGYTEKVYEDYYKTAAMFCNLFSSFLNGTFKEDHCPNLVSRYRCMKLRYRDVPLCRMRTDPLLLKFEKMCGKPKETLAQPPHAEDAGMNVKSVIAHTLIMVLAAMLL